MEGSNPPANLRWSLCAQVLLAEPSSGVDLSSTGSGLSKKSTMGLIRWTQSTEHSHDKSENPNESSTRQVAWELHALTHPAVPSGRSVSDSPFLSVKLYISFCTISDDSPIERLKIPEYSIIGNLISWNEYELSI